MQLTPTPPTPQPVPEPAFGLDWLLQNGVGIAIIAGVLLLFILAARKLFKRRPREELKEEEPKELPSPEARLKVELPPSEAEAAKLRAVEEAHREAEALAQKRKELADAAKATGDSKERARLEQEARALKDQEDEKKREEYRAKKDAEREAKDRKVREREEQERLEREAAEQARREAAEAEARRKEEEARKVAAEAGQTLARGLDKTRNQGFIGRINQLFGGGPKQVDEGVLAELEEVLFTADIGVKTASRLVEVARDKAKKNELSSADGIKSVIRKEVEQILSLPQPTSLKGGGPPHVVMVVGVNGAGKTTTIGKLAAKLTASGKKVVLAAGDTFRAAATEQLDVWADRAKAELIKGPDGSDPGSVVFDAVKKARDNGADVVIADTAGRLHTKAPLMEELKKVRRVMDKALPGAPHEVLLVLDATVGQNAIAQAKQFQEAVGVTAIALTKLDGTAKGGVVIGISDELKIPVAWVGIGETVADLKPFDPKEFVAALFD